MSTSDRRPYLSATALTQDVLDNSADNLTNKLETVAEITFNNQTLYISDRHKFIGNRFYEARAIFPSIINNIGDWLSGVLEFPTLEITINNADKKFNNLMPGGADYDGFIDADVVIKVGLAENASTYLTVYSGKVTDIGGFNRNVQSFTLVVRPDFDKVNVTIPDQVFLESDFPDIEDNFIGLAAPVIYGDWTTSLRLEAPQVPAFPINGNNIAVNDTLGDITAGNTPLRCVVSSTPLQSLDTTSVTLRRGSDYYTFAGGDISIVGGTNNTTFDITQKNLMVDGSPWVYETGDEIFVKCIGIDLGTFDDNIVAQGRDILERFGGLVAGDFDSSWDTFRDKGAPADTQNRIADIKCRVWIQESVGAFEYVLSMFEQVRLEAFINRSRKFEISSLHFDDFIASPSFTIRNWDIVRDTLTPEIDQRNNFNRAQADYDFNPASGQNRRSTPVFRNQAAITQANDREISKLITFPNLYDPDQVEEQLTEIIRLASGQTELVTMGWTTRMFLKDLSEFVKMNIDIGATVYDEIPALIRSLEYDPRGPSIIAKVWSFQLINFPGYTGPAGTVAGYDATITQET